MPRLPIPYFETSRYKVELMVKLAGDVKNKRVADLGSGDGRIAIAFGKAGAQVTGLELDSEFVNTSRKRIKDNNLEEAIHIKQENFWDADLSSFEIITIYPMPDVMLDLEEKLKKELVPGCKVITNYYTFPSMQLASTCDNVYLYVIS